MEILNNLVLLPILTEKTNNLASFGIMTFKVSKDLNKCQIKSLVEKLFQTEVKNVNIINVRGKVRKFHGKVGQRSNYKKALVFLKGNAKIDMSKGIKQ